jgi:predicted 3-demethylubiquinone-9 3-methyltransferase (glyoxalase superfamily)
MKISSKIAPCLWFDNQAEEAANFYTGIFKDSKIVVISRYGEVGQEIHGQKPGTVMTVAFELEGQSFTALNGGPIFKFNEAISLQINWTARTRSTTTGTSFRPVAMKKRSNAAGSRTASAFPGKSCRVC